MLNKIIFLTPKVKKDFFKEYVPKHIYDNLQFIKLDNFFITDRVYFFKEKNEIYFWNFFKNQKEKLIDYEINDIKSLVDKLDDKPIIYTSKQKVKENAILLSKSSNNTIENNVKNLIDYFKENIGEKYFINIFLKKDIFIHTGSIDKTGRLLMENKFKNSNNFTLIANQTIISGINMNCKNLIVETSRTDGKNFKKGNFLNLVGRVGRYNTQHNSYLGTVFCLKSSNKICDEILRSKKFLNLEDYQIHTKDDLNKLREKDQDLSYDDKVLNKMYENKIQGFKNFIPIFLKNDNHDFYKQKIIEDKDFFQNYFKGTKTQENIKSFIEKIINIFEWSNSFNPFLASSNNDDSWKTILILYYTNYINGKTIKQMVKEFLEYSKKNSKQYYVIENKKGKHLTTRQYNDYKKEKNRAANEDDIIETCIETNISWIEHKLNSFIYFVVFTLQEEGIDIDIEEDIDGFKNNLEKELLSLGIERHLIHEIVEKYGRENFTIEQLIKNIDENDKGYIKDIFVSCGIIQT